MVKKRINEEKLKQYQAQGYWKGMTIAMCREYEDRGYWPGLTLGDFFDSAVKDFPNNEAIVFQDRRITYSEYGQIVNNVASNLIRLGIKKGDVVCTCLPNCPEFMFLQVALAKIGAIIQPIHLAYRKAEFIKRLDFCGATALVVVEMLKDFSYVNMVKEIKDSISTLKQVIVVGKEAPTDMISFKSLCDKPEKDYLSEYLAQTEVDANDILLLNFTSGTEMDPKGFLHVHNTILGNTKTMCEVCNFERGKEILLSFSPMTHTFGHMITYFGIISAGKIIIVEMYDPEETLKLIQKEKITYMQGTPAHLTRFLNHKDFPNYDLSSLRVFATGGAPISPELIQTFKNKLPKCGLTNWFGMGEDIVHTYTKLDDPPEILINTVGKPSPGSEIKIVNEKREEVKTGEVGEICYRGANMFLGYYKNRERTEETRSSDGWFYTGDEGLVDEQGYLRLRGRKKEVINRGGTKIFPLTVENVLCFHPKVASVVVVGMPDPELGERVCAYIVTKGGQEITVDEIKSYMQEKGMSRYEIPERIELRPQFPMLPSGKIDRSALRKEIAEIIKQERASLSSK